MEFIELAMLCEHAADRASDRAHYNGLCLDHILAELDTLEHRPRRYAGRGKKTISSHHVLDLIFLLRVLDSHLGRSRAQLLGVDNQAGLHLAANASQRC